MTTEEFIKKWNVAFESKEQELEFAAEMRDDLMEIKIEWYKKLAKKLERIKIGELSLDVYIKEVNAKIETRNESSRLGAVTGSLRFSDREVDFAYLCGVFNTSGIDGLHNEIQRLKELGKQPHNIIQACHDLVTK